MMTWPVAVRPAAPTRNSEHGAYAGVAASRAASLSSGQSIVVTHVSSHVPGPTTGAGHIRKSTKPTQNAPQPADFRGTSMPRGRKRVRNDSISSAEHRISVQIGPPGPGAAAPRAGGGGGGGG